MPIAISVNKEMFLRYTVFIFLLLFFCSACSEKESSTKIKPNQKPKPIDKIEISDADAETYLVKFVEYNKIVAKCSNELKRASSLSGECNSLIDFYCLTKTEKNDWIGKYIYSHAIDSASTYVNLGLYEKYFGKSCNDPAI